LRRGRGEEKEQKKIFLGVDGRCGKGAGGGGEVGEQRGRESTFGGKSNWRKRVKVFRKKRLFFLMAY